MKMKHTPAALATLVLLSGLATSAFAQDRKTYIVQLKDEPAASYQGTISGLAATQPAPGQTFKYGSAAVQAYVNYLGQQQSNVISLVGNAPVVATYNTVFNGFAASLTEDEARKLVANSQVVGIWEDDVRKLDTISTSKFLKLSEPGGLWSKTVNGNALKGEGMVIGVIDGGIWPENPAFFDRVDVNGEPSNNPADTQVYGPPPATFTGACVAGEGITAAHCNNKLVGIRHYRAGWLANNVLSDFHWTDFVSGRDSVGGATGHGGHGDHTASTAAGNSNVPVIINGGKVGTASGMAPRARVAAYKVCWTKIDPGATDGTGTSNGCWPSDSLAAIDQAVADGVNVINYSISGSQTSVNDPVEQAFYRAALAGVFVAASAGNNGPAQAVAHISPWLTTVAASTHDRAFSGSTTLGNGASYTGGSTTATGLGSTPMILAENAGVGGGNASLCFSASPPAGQVLLDPAKVAGKLVVCTRGTNARVDKGQAVKNAGGVGMILANASAGQTIDADFQSVPTVQVDNVSGAAVKAYVTSAASPTGAISPAVIGTKAAPLMGSFSSRGPNAGDSNVLKPDVTAPGVDIIAQMTPALDQAQRDQVAAGTLVPPPAWDTLNGTSMASPHVAGVALLLKQANPTWGPGAIKSALMTSAFSTLDDGLTGAQNGLLPWAQGAGHIDPQKANDPGLVYNAGKNDWVKYQCKVNRAAVSPASDCTTIGTLDETYNLNLPSITVGTVTGSTIVSRSVTNVGASTATYTASATLPGFTATVSPATLTLAPGETKSFTVTIVGAGAAQGVWQFGQLVWNDGTHNVRIPVQARAGKAISAPAEFTDTRTSGSKLFTVRTGFTGRMTAAKGGLKDVTMGAERTLMALATSSSTLLSRCRSNTDYDSIAKYNFTVPAGAIVARWALRQADVSGANDDHDMVVSYPNGTTSQYSGNDGSNETLQVVAPAAGTYRVCVLAYGGASSMKHKLSSWIVSPGDAGGLNAVVPSTVYAGSTATVGLAWTGLTTGKRTVGGTHWLDASGNVQATTVLRVSTDGALPVQNEPSSVPSKLVDESLAQ